MIRKLTHSKIMIFLLIIFVWLFPSTINMPDQTQQYSVVLGVGIDKMGEQYEVSTQVLTSKSNQGFLEALQVHSSVGKNIMDAIENLSLHTGRIAGFGNTSVIVFSEEVAQEGIEQFLDFFVRSKRLNGNPVLMITKNKAKDILSDVAKIDESFNYSLNSLAHLNKEFASGTMCTMEDFLDDYFSETKATFVAQVNEETDDSKGIEIPSQNSSTSSSGVDGGGSGGSQTTAGGDNKKVLSNSGESSLFKDGKQIAVASEKIVEGYNILNKSVRNIYTIDNVNDEIYHNAQVVLSVKNKVLTKKYEFSKTGIPRVIFEIHYTLKVEQIIEQNNNLILVNGSQDYVTPTLVNMFKTEVKKDVSNALNFAKENKADIYGFQQAFERHKPKQWKKYLKNLPDKGNAFQNIEVFLKIQVKGNL